MLGKLAVVVPCYNEEEMLYYTADKLECKIKDLIFQKKITETSYILFVHDGSKDSTWDKIAEKAIKNPMVVGVKLSKNHGHQNALLAGLMSVKDKCDMSISIDADLQDDINCIDEMVEEFSKGNEIVYGVRNDREEDSFFKRTTAEVYYKILKKLGGDIVFNHADFRLMSNVALIKLSEFPEVNLFLRGMVPLVGYQTSSVFYTRKKRIAGESKYPLKKMLYFAFEGITSLSVSLLRWITMLGGIVTLISIFMFFYSILKYFRGETISGWSSLIVSLWFLGGVILFTLGIIGEYIGKIYLETKKRPRYIIEKIIE